MAREVREPRLVKITKRAVDAAHHEEEEYFLSDTELKGFVVRVRPIPSKVKSYGFRYRIPPGPYTLITIGKHGTAFTPDEARKEAELHRASVRRGENPVAKKRAKLHAPKVKIFLAAYAESDSFKANALSTQKISKGRIHWHLSPTLGNKDALTLSSAAIKRAFEDIRDGKTAADVKTGVRGRARPKGGDGAAGMAIQLLSTAYNWELRQKQHDRLLPLLKENPCTGLDLWSSTPRDTILDKVHYTRMYQALARLPKADPSHPSRLPKMRKPAADAIALGSFTGMRRGEIAGLRWEHVDLKTGLITLPPSSHKAGRKTKKPRIIGLPAVAQAVIAQQIDPEHPPGPKDFVFRPAKGNGPISLSKPWRLVRKEAGLPTGIGLHGLRHSLASHMAMNGAEAAEIMTQLGHQQISTSQIYVHWAKSARQPLAERAAATAIAGFNEATSEQPPADVLPLKEQGSS